MRHPAKIVGITVFDRSNTFIAAFIVSSYDTEVEFSFESKFIADGEVREGWTSPRRGKT